jgi:hypothetical protein
MLTRSGKWSGDGRPPTCWPERRQLCPDRLPKAAGRWSPTCWMMCGPRGAGTVRDVVATRVTVGAAHPRAVRTRVAWLLRSLRRCATDPEVLVARRFAAAFPHSERSRGVAPSQVTRWESGRTRVGYAVLRGYERALGLQRRSLVAVVDSCMRHDAGTIGAPVIGPRVGAGRGRAPAQTPGAGRARRLDWPDVQP